MHPFRLARATQRVLAKDTKDTQDILEAVMRHHYLKPSTLGLFALALVAGCSSKSNSQDDEGPGLVTEEQQLDMTNGGYDTNDTDPYFADPQVQALEVMETASADTTDMTADVASVAGATSYHVALIWGHLPPAQDATDADSAPNVMDWNGSVSVDAGAIGLKRTLQFDAHDSVLPRTDPTTVSFDSHTLPFVDGLYLKVVIPAGSSPKLHFATATLTTDIDLSQLAADGFGVDRLPDNLNGLAYAGYTDVPNCARGLMLGRWVKDRAALGRFRGVVIDGDGEALGHVRGIWGHAPKHDANLFFGKYIDTAGQFRGLLGGTYGDGSFSGVWGTRDPSNVGHLEGVYSDGYDRDDGRGVYIGRWSEACK